MTLSKTFHITLQRSYSRFKLKITDCYVLRFFKTLQNFCIQYNSKIKNVDFKIVSEIRDEHNYRNDLCCKIWTYVFIFFYE